MLLGLLVAPLAQAAVRARLDSDRIAPGETVQLILEHDGQTNDQPDLTPLRQDFDVLVTSRSSSVQIVNGSVSSRVRTQLTLSPRRTGQLSVPSIEWGGESSPELVLTVEGSAGQRAPGSGGAQPASRVFVETVVGQKDPFVQAAVNLTVRVFTTDQLYQASLDLPATNDALIQQVGGDENRSVERGGVRYDVVERHYVIFPQRSGELKLPGAVLNAQIAVHVRSDPYGNDAFADAFGIAGGLMTSTKPIRVSGEPIELAVRPRPPQVQASYWLPARGITLTGDWRPDQPEAHVGDPVTLALHLQADGLTAAQLPDLASLVTLPAGLKSYPDQAKLNNVAQGDRILGTRDQKIALIADQPGRFEVPPVTVAWWDTRTDQARETTLPGRTIDILPALNAPSAGRAAAAVMPPTADTAAAEPGKAAPDTGTGWGAAIPAVGGRLWLELSVGLSLLWVATVLAWWWSRRRRRGDAAVTAGPAATGEPGRATRDGGHARAARSLFHEACRRSDAPAARRQLLAWAAAAWPEHAPTGLQALSAQLGNAEIAARLGDLDRACYGGEPWNGAALAALLRELPARPPPRHGGGGQIAPLYP
jgi:hypothetical protein